MRRILALVVALTCVTAGSAGCSASGSGSGGTVGAEQLIARWPDGLGSLDLAPQADTFEAGVRRADQDVNDVQVRSLTGRGGILSSAVRSDGGRLPDVVFVGASHGLARTTDTAALHRTVLAGVLDAAGVADGVAYTDTFAGPDSLSGGSISAGTTQSTWCAFVAHGVGVVVLGSTLTRAQDETLARDLQQ